MVYDGGMARQGCLLIVCVLEAELSVIAVDLRGQVLVRERAGIEVFSKQEGWLGFGAYDLVSLLRSCVNKVFQHGKVAPGDVQGIGICGDARSLVVWDGETGEPVCEGLLGGDVRAQYETYLMAQNSVGEHVRSLSCLPVLPVFLGAKLKFLRGHNKAIQHGIESGGIQFGTMMSWALYQLSGRVEYLIDLGSAAQSQLYNPVTGSWDGFLVKEFLGLDLADGALSQTQDEGSSRLLPEIREPGAGFGVTNGFLPVPNGVPIFGMCDADGARLLAHGCDEMGEAQLVLGDLIQVLVHTGGQPRQVNAGFSNWKLGVQKGFAYGGYTAGVKGVYEALLGLGLSQNGHIQGMDLETVSRLRVVPSRVSESDELVFPGSPQDVMFHVLGIGPGVGADQVHQALYFALFCQVRSLVLRLEDVLGMRLKEVSVDGELGDKNWVCQSLSDMLQISVKRFSHEESLVSGMLVLSGLGDSSLGKLDRTFLPEMDPLTSFSLYEGWAKQVGG